MLHEQATLNQESECCQTGMKICQSQDHSGRPGSDNTYMVMGTLIKCGHGCFAPVMVL